MATTTAPQSTTGEQAVNAALVAGFEIARHAATVHGYWHDMTHPDGRRVSVYTALGSGRLVSAQGYNRNLWNTTRLAARSVPALERMLAANQEPSC